MDDEEVSNEEEVNNGWRVETDEIGNMILVNTRSPYPPQQDTPMPQQLEQNNSGADGINSCTPENTVSRNNSPTDNSPYQQVESDGQENLADQDDEIAAITTILNMPDHLLDFYLKMTQILVQWNIEEGNFMHMHMLEIAEIIRNVLSELLNYCGANAIDKMNVDKQLGNWASRQQLVSTGSEWDIRNEATVLERIDENFDKIGEKIEAMFNEVANSRERHSLFWAEYDQIYKNLLGECQKVCADLYKDLVILSIQPPPLLVKSTREVKQTKFSFPVKVVLLGVKSLLRPDANENDKCFEILSCELTSMTQPKQFVPCQVFSLKSSVQEKVSSTSKKVSSTSKKVSSTSKEVSSPSTNFSSPSTNFSSPSTLSNTTTPLISNQCETQPQKSSKLPIPMPIQMGTNFCEWILELSSPSEKKPRGKKEMLYKILWTVNVKLKHGISFVKELYSFPFHIWTTNDNNELNADAFLERIFGYSAMEMSEEEMPEEMPEEKTALITLMQDALEMKFRSIASSPPKETKVRAKSDRSRGKRIESFPPRFRDYLINMLGTCSPTMLFPKNYKHKKVPCCISGDMVPFCDWFTALPQLIAARTPLYYNLWKNGLIWFCGKDEAEKLLMESAEPGTFMIRVSQSIFKCFKISSRRPDKPDVEHYPCLFYNTNCNELLAVQMRQKYKYLLLKKILMWNSKNNAVKSVDFDRILKEIDKTEYELLSKMAEEYEPSKGIGLSSSIDYHRNQRPFGTDSYLRFRWLRKFFNRNSEQATQGEPMEGVQSSSQSACSGVRRMN